MNHDGSHEKSGYHRPMLFCILQLYLTLLLSAMGTLKLVLSDKVMSQKICALRRHPSAVLQMGDIRSFGSATDSRLQGM